MAWTSPRTWVAGEKPTAATLNTHIRDNFKAIGDAWASYTPTWTASTTNPTIGNGSLTGAYISVGKLVIGRFTIAIGSTTTVGTGNYRVSLPVAAAASVGTVGQGFFNDTSATNSMIGLILFSTTSVQMLQPTAGLVTAGSPAVPANGDNFYGFFTYEAA